MPSDKDREGLRDLTDKLRNAKEAAERDDAGKREEADLKILEQEVQAKKLRARRPAKPVRSPSRPSKPDDADAKLDKALKDSFPGSDPVSFVEAAPLKEGDASLSTVPDSKRKER
jgi:hypothetical protein